jgi:hypothetical protein
VSTLEDIIRGATTEDVSVPSLLRMMKVVGTRTETAVLIDWVDNELGGYYDGATLPQYRGPFSAQVLSDWSGPFGAASRNVPFPPTALPEGYRGSGFDLSFYESVSELEQLAEATQPLSGFWPADAVAMLNNAMNQGIIPRPMPGYGLVSAHKVISPAQVQSVLDAVRTRALGVALELEKILPQAGEPGAKNQDSAQISYIVTNEIYGDGNTVAVDSPGAVQISATVTPGDLGSLLAAATNMGLSPDDVAELKAAVEADEAEAPGAPRSRVREFLGKFTLEGAKTVGKVGIGAAGGVLAELVRVYYGI